MKKKCYSCEKTKEVFHWQENRELDGSKYEIPICYECYKEYK